MTSMRVAQLLHFQANNSGPRPQLGPPFFLQNETQNSTRLLVASTFKETNTEAEKGEKNHSTKYNKKKVVQESITNPSPS